MDFSSADGQSDNALLNVTAKCLVGKIRSLKERISNEMKMWKETNADNRKLEVNIQQSHKRLKTLNMLCANCEAQHAEIELRKKRYSEQLTKISRLISEQNFDAANWAIILDEMAFVNRELFETLMSTAAAERKALNVVKTEEERYMVDLEKLLLKRVELRKQLYSEMDWYESLRSQIKNTESSLSQLRKAIDVYDAEYWQLDDAKQDMQSQIFQLQELCRHTQELCNYDSDDDFSFQNDNGRPDAPKAITEKVKTVPQLKGEANFETGKFEPLQQPKKELFEETSKACENSTSSLRTQSSQYSWGHIVSNFLDEPQKLPFDPHSTDKQRSERSVRNHEKGTKSSSVESFKTTLSQPLQNQSGIAPIIASSGQTKVRKSEWPPASKGREEKIMGIKDQIEQEEKETEEELVTDLRTSELELVTDKTTNKISDDDKTDLRSEPLSFNGSPDITPSTTNVTRDQISCEKKAELLKSSRVYEEGDLEYQSERQVGKEDYENKAMIRKDHQLKCPKQKEEFNRQKYECQHCSQNEKYQQKECPLSYQLHATIQPNIEKTTEVDYQSQQSDHCSKCHLRISDKTSAQVGEILERKSREENFVGKTFSSPAYNELSLSSSIGSHSKEVANVTGGKNRVISKVSFPGKSLLQKEHRQAYRPSYNRLLLGESTVHGERKFSPLCIDSSNNVPQCTSSSGTSLSDTSLNGTSSSGTSSIQKTREDVLVKEIQPETSQTSGRKVEFWEEISERTFLRDIAQK